MFKKPFKILLICSFLSSFLAPIPQVRAQGYLNLPEPGTMVSLSSNFEPVIMKGLIVHPENPLMFDFVVDIGQDKLVQEELKNQGEKLIKYFLASLAIPENDLWVNLSPYEKDRTIPEALSHTDMGRDLLAQDYMLKQVTASMIYPEKQLGKTFWDKVYAQAQQLYGTTQIPVNTFNKVWIVADRAEVYEQNNTAFVVDQHLKVMLEEDYLALQKNNALGRLPTSKESNVTNQIVREIVLPALENEVNKGKNFAPLRQIYNSLILASWYKNTLKDVLLNQVYSNQKKVNGIDLKDTQVKEKIYQQYLKAYKKGVFNYIKEDVDGLNSSNRIPRKYFSGGLQSGVASKPVKTNDRRKLDSAMASSLKLHVFKVDLNLRQADQVFSNSSDQAMSVKRPSNYIRTVTWFKEKESEFQIRISDIFDLEVREEEKRIILEEIANDGDIFLLSEETLKLAKDGTVNITLQENMGIIPRKYLGRTISLSENVMELLEDFHPQSIPSEVKKHKDISIKAGAFYKIKVFDKKTNKSLYLLSLNSGELNKGRLKISPVGGGYQFLPGGIERYKTQIGQIQTMQGEDSLEIRVVVPFMNWPIFLRLFDSGIGRETDGLRELREELNGPSGVFRNGLPAHWLNPPTSQSRDLRNDEIILSVEPPVAEDSSVGGIDLNPNNMQTRVKKLDLGVQMQLDLATIQKIKDQGFDFLEIEIQSISPINLPLLLNLQS